MKLYRGRKMDVSSENPHTGGPVFHCFDNIHLFKNFDTNFMNKKPVMYPEYPPFEQIHANFDDIVKLHELELGKTVKYADKLNDKCLKPATIERSNVSLAVSVFHESTINWLEPTPLNS